MDMWPAYISATASGLPDGRRKIAFDKFHVAAHLGSAVDKVRRQEHRLLQAASDDSLVSSRYLWLYHPDHVPKHLRLRRNAEAERPPAALRHAEESRRLA